MNQKEINSLKSAVIYDVNKLLITLSRLNKNNKKPLETKEEFLKIYNIEREYYKKYSNKYSTYGRHVVNCLLETKSIKYDLLVNNYTKKTKGLYMNFCIKSSCICPICPVNGFKILTSLVHLINNTLSHKLRVQLSMNVEYDKKLAVELMVQKINLAVLSWIQHGTLSKILCKVLFKNLTIKKFDEKQFFTNTFNNKQLIEDYFTLMFSETDYLMLKVGKNIIQEDSKNNLSFLGLCKDENNQLRIQRLESLLTQLLFDTPLAGFGHKRELKIKETIVYKIIVQYLNNITI